MDLQRKETITSLELLNQINYFRNEIEGKAELKHYTLLEIIKDEFEDEIGAQKILGGSYFDKQNQQRPMFELTLSQARQVLIRENKQVRKAVIKYIDNIEKMSSKPKALTLKETLQIALELEEENEKLQKKIETEEPLVNYSKAVLGSSDAIAIGAFCKVIFDKKGINIGRNIMFEKLRKHGYLISKKGREYNLPKQQYIQQGLFEVKQSVSHKPNGDKLTPTPLITGKGQIYIMEKLLNSELE